MNYLRGIIDLRTIFKELKKEKSVMFFSAILNFLHFHYVEK